MKQIKYSAALKADARQQLLGKYKTVILAYLIMLPLLAVLAVIVPFAAYRRTQKESIVQRLQDTEN